MVDATVSFAIGKLSNFLQEQVNIRIGVKDGVRWLKDELGYLRASVRFAEARQEEDLIRIWINDVIDVANEAVSVLERFSTLQEEQGDTEQGVLDGFWSCVCICKKEANLYDIGNEIESIKGKVIQIKNRRVEYSISNILDISSVQKRKRALLRAASFQNMVDVVGYDDDDETLLAQLVKDDPSRRVIAIHGMGGLGKSTLASKLYHSSDLIHLQARAWVCVSEEYVIKDILQAIIKSFWRDKLKHEDLDLITNKNEVDLLHYLREYLLKVGGPFLAVIDDIWDIDIWEKIKEAFPDQKNGSRIIITTRDKEVAQKVDDRSYVHELRFLRENECWELFCKRAKPTTLGMENLGKEMVHYCGGLPLSIVVLSGLLSNKSYVEWSKVKDNIWGHLKRNDKGKYMEIQEILSLSYNELSYKLGQCFLYLARFPEDHKFQLDNLKHLWIAEDFIDEEDGLTKEDVADDYLTELINRNMVQVAALFWDGQVAVCMLHDLVRELAIQKAKEHKLLGIFDSSKQHLSSIDLLQGQPRHAIYNGIGEYLHLLGHSFDDLNLRSLAVINRHGTCVKLEDIMLMYTRFKNLKVLDLTSVKSDIIAPEIGSLTVLKFLGLVCSISGKTLVIPSTIGKLKKLQTLSSFPGSSYEFPKEIFKLKELRHVNANGAEIDRQQTKIQTLKTIKLEKWIDIETVNLINLHTLFIEDSSGKENTCTLESVANLKSLQTFSLDMTNSNIPTLEPLSSCACLKKVSLFGRMKDRSEISFLPDSFTDLTMHYSKFTDDPMLILESLPNLTGLDLRDVYTGEKMVCRRAAFPNLQIFRLGDLPKLEEWQVEEGALPSLRGFEKYGCEKLKIVPQVLKCAPSIPELVSKTNLMLLSIDLQTQLLNGISSHYM